MKSFYTLLNVKTTASASELRSAYLEFLRKNHPDKQTGDDNSKKGSYDTSDVLLNDVDRKYCGTVIELGKRAWQTLSNHGSRKTYDNWLKEHQLRTDCGWLTVGDRLSVAEVVEIDRGSLDEATGLDIVGSVEVDCRCGGAYVIDRELLDRVIDEVNIRAAMSLLGSSPLRGRSATELDQGRVKILVLGEAGVGKTTFVQSAKGKAVRSPLWTVGCSVEVIDHSFKAGTPQETIYCVELWDVGGSKSHRNARRVFYQSAHAVILVHDRTNRKSEENLRAWLDELMESRNSGYSSGSSGAGGSASSSYSLQRSSSQGRLLPTTVFDSAERYFGDGKALPILVVGTKSDQLTNSHNGQSGVSSSSKAGAKSLATDFGVEEIWLDCREPMSPGSTNFVKLSRFFDSVIQTEYYGAPTGGAARKRTGALYQATGGRTDTTTDRWRKIQ